MDHGRIMIMVDIRAMCTININTKINMYVSVSQIPPMEDDVAPDALIEEGTHHVEEDVEDPEEAGLKNNHADPYFLTP